VRGRGLKILRARAETAREGPPGTLLAIERDGLVVAAGEGSALRLLDVQPESRNAMPAAAFAVGARLAPGERLG
jgi:methionyl-tRNA formyltransferase